jgi:hypothetical protein
VKSGGGRVAIVGCLRSLAHRAAYARQARWGRSAYRRARASARREHRPLPTRQERRLIRIYARQVLGSRRHRHWLYLYTLVHGSFREGWLPDDVYELRVLPQVNMSYRDISGAKTLARRLLASPELPDLAYRIHGAWYGPDLEPLSSEEVQARCFPDGADHEVVIKGESSNQGRAITVVNREGFSALDLERIRGAVIQRRIRQHAFFESIVPGCTATVRVTTVHHAGHVRLVGSYLRVGRSGDRYVRSARQLRVVVTAADGSLGPNAFTADWGRTPVHPDTGFVFNGARLPGYRDMVETCRSLHARVPQFTIVGWDVLVDDAGRTVVFEWNTDHPDIKFTEAVLGPGLTDLSVSHGRP